MSSNRQVTDKPTEAIVDADFLVYKVGFSNEKEEEQWALNRLTEWFTDIIYMRLKCDDYRAWITGKTNFRILTGDRVDNIEGIRGIGPVKADKILKDCTTERELYEACIKAYDGNTDRVLENGKLLWLRRKPNQMWQPPSVSQEPSGQ